MIVRHATRLIRAPDGHLMIGGLWAVWIAGTKSNALENMCLNRLNGGITTPGGVVNEETE